MILSEKKFTYGDIPDILVTKRYFPLARHLWRIYTELGYEDLVEEALPNLSVDMIYDVFKARLDQSMATAKDVLDGTITNPDKRLAWMLFPPVVPLRADLTQGTNKLLFGESLDVTFYVMNDVDQELVFLFNGHIEHGVPVDWWVVGPDDDPVTLQLLAAFGHCVNCLCHCCHSTVSLLGAGRAETSPSI